MYFHSISEDPGCARVCDPGSKMSVVRQRRQMSQTVQHLCLTDSNSSRLLPNTRNSRMYQSEGKKIDPAILEVFAKAADAAELSSVQPNPIGLGAFSTPSVYGPFIDTVKLKANIELSPEFIEKVYWCKQTSEFKSGDSNQNIWWVAKLEEGIGIKCEYRPCDYTEKPLFMAEFSIPKLLYGTNIYALPDLGDAYLRIQQIWDGMENLPPLSVWDTELMILHYGVNIPVEQRLIPYYLAALMKEKLPNRQTTEFRPKESVRYPSKSRTLQIYCKYRQTNLMKAELTGRTPPTTEASEPSKPFVLFTVDGQYPERTR